MRLNSNYTPDHWVVLKINYGDETIYKVLAGWDSSYLTGTSWRLNSGITKFEEFENHYEFSGSSGSTYCVSKHSYGLHHSMASPYNQITMQHGDVVDLMEPDTIWSSLTYL